MQFRPNQIADWYIGLNLNSFYIVFGFDDLNITKKKTKAKDWANIS